MGYMAGLEVHRTSHVIERRIYLLAFHQPLHNLRRALAVATLPSVTGWSVAGLNGVARVDLRTAVAADHLPVGAAGQPASRQALPGEAPAGDGDDASAP